METRYRVVRLLKNCIYPTYQLRAVMDNKKTDLRDGLRLGALTTLDWLKSRMGNEDLPEVLARLPEPGEYRTAEDACLTSFHINRGFVVDVVALPDKGLWTLQITEPDLGSDPGDPQQVRQAMPGRMIETNVAFRAAGRELECGFQTVISDPEGTAFPAEVYRLSPVRRLLENPAFGLRQIVSLSKHPAVLTSAAQLKSAAGVWQSREGHLPCVVFTQVRQDQPAKAGLHFGGDALIAPDRGELPLVLPRPGNLPAPGRETPASAQDPPYDVEAFAARGVGFCRTYLLSDGLLKQFSRLTETAPMPGDIVVLEPKCFGGRARIFPFKESRQRQEETMAALWELIGSYPRGKDVSFGGLTFLSAAHEALLHQTQEARQQSSEVSGQWQQKLEQLRVSWEGELERREDRIRDLTEQVDRQRRYIDQLKDEKRRLWDEARGVEEKCRRALERQREEIAYLERKITQPTRHEEIPAWVEAHFSGRLLLHPKAVNLLSEKGAQKVDAGLICDALDFLATDYWDRRYRRISSEEMNTRCSQKYGRPFEVTPIGSTTIEFTPGQYKIKYFPGRLGKPVESPLDFHLRVGNDAENLLRIYFLHDDEKQLIVVGSLPEHLKTVTIK